MGFVELVQNVGFPIACVGCLACYVKSLTETHKEEVKELTDKINKQTLTIQKLVDKIDELLRGGNNENE